MSVTTRITVAVLGLVIVLASMGVGYGLWAKTLVIDGSVANGYINADFTAASTNDPSGIIDPGYAKDVGSCTAEVIDDQTVTATLSNAYPSYQCELYVTMHNGGTVPERIDLVDITSPPEITVDELNGLSGTEIDPGQSVQGTFLVHVEQEALQGQVYTFTITIPSTVWIFGTPGFWKNWDSHNTYTQGEIEGRLVEIAASSSWLDATSVADMEAVFAAALGGHAPMESRFLAHYLATRLNNASGILNPAALHDVTGPDPGKYLGLATPSAATLTEIIPAIEGKWGTSPTNREFNIMKDVCDALNNRTI